MGVVKTSDSSIPSYIEGDIKKYTKSSINSETPRRYAQFPQTLSRESLYNPKDGNSKNTDNVVKLSNLNVNDTGLSFTEVTSLLQKALYGIDELGKTASIYIDPGTTNTEDKQRLKEAEDKLIRMQKQFSLYKYYSFIWIFSIALFSFFVLMLVAGIFSPFVSLTGLIATIVGGIGAYIDWKDREKGL